MTHEQKGTAMEAVLQPIFERGFDGIGEVLSSALNFAMLVERENALGAQPYERTPERAGHANGFKPRTLKTRVGELSLRVPQVRGAETPFRTSVLERGQRHERALALSLAEMYVQGIATRRVTEVLETMCGCPVSSEQVSRASALLDEELEKRRNRPLGCVKALILDAFYEKVRRDGAVDCLSCGRPTARPPSPNVTAFPSLTLRRRLDVARCGVTHHAARIELPQSHQSHT